MTESPMSVPTSFLSLSEAAACLRKSYGQTLRLVMLGLLKGEKRNGRWIVDQSDLNRVLELTMVRQPASESRVPH